MVPHPMCAIIASILKFVVVTYAIIKLLTTMIIDSKWVGIDLIEHQQKCARLGTEKVDHSVLDLSLIIVLTEVGLFDENWKNNSANTMN